MSPKSKYEFAGAVNGSLSDAQAIVVGKELQRIEKRDGSLVPDAVVTEARPKSSPLHVHFTWDNTKAADDWRRQEARMLIRSVVLLQSEANGDAEPIRAFLHVHAHDTERNFEGQSYMSTVAAMSDKRYRAQVEERALSELLTWKKRYEQLKKFSKVFGAIEQLAEAK